MAAQQARAFANAAEKWKKRDQATKVTAIIGEELWERSRLGWDFVALAF